MIQAAQIRPVHTTPIEAKIPVIKVIGLGGGGCNAVNRMIELGISGVEFIAANTDSQALRSSLAPKRIQLGPFRTRGLGSGGDPSVGKASAEESTKALGEALNGADLVFLTAGMGGGTGTGAIAVAAKVARSLGAVTVSIVTTPFSFERGRRQNNATEGINELRSVSDTLITVPNDRLLQIAPRDLPIDLAFRLADDVLRQGVQGISELITQPGLINVDFSHVRQMMQTGGGSFLTIGIGEGEGKARKAIERALHHPLIESVPIENATGIIANFTGGRDLTFLEVTEALQNLQEKTNNQANIIPGVMNNDLMEGRVEVIMVITGLASIPMEQPRREVQVQKTEKVVEAPRPAAQAAVPRDVPVLEFVATPQDLDIPAFLRRRIR